MFAQIRCNIHGIASRSFRMCFVLEHIKSFQTSNLSTKAKHKCFSFSQQTKPRKIHRTHRSVEKCEFPCDTSVKGISYEPAYGIRAAITTRYIIRLCSLTWPKSVRSFSAAIFSASAWPPSTCTTHVLEYTVRVRHVAKFNIIAATANEITNM